MVLRICPRLPAGALLVKFLTLALKVEGSSLACGHLNVQLNGIEEIKDFLIHHEDKKESFDHKETNFENYCQFRGVSLFKVIALYLCTQIIITTKVRVAISREKFLEGARSL